MNENLNLIEILKNYPKGHVLYSTIHGEVKFSHIDKDDEYPIVLIHSDIDYEYVDSFGKYLSEHNGECTLFPSKDERDWSKFTVFKDGDILSSYNTCFIFNGCFDNGSPCAHGGIDSFGRFFKSDYKNIQWTSSFVSHATDSEKLKLLIKMQECGYYWNNKNKTINKII